MENKMENTKREAEAYSDYVRQQMGDTLSETVAEIVQKRPADPIEYLADKLYKLGNRRPPSRANSMRRRDNIGKWNPPWSPPNSRHQTEITVTSTYTTGTMTNLHNRDRKTHIDVPTCVVHKSASSGGVHKSASSDIVHKSASSGSVHKSASSDIVHKSASSDIVHKSASSDIVHKSASSDIVHKSASSDIVHKSASSDIVHKSASSDIVHKSASSDSVHKSALSGIVQSNTLEDDFIDEDIYGDYGTFVHGLSTKMFSAITDIFDDDDIT